MLDEAGNFASSTIGGANLAGWCPAFTSFTRQSRCAVTIPNLAACSFWIATSLHLDYGNQHNQQQYGQDKLQLGCHR